MQSIKTDGNCESIVPISFENRFKIRPEEFLLKKYIFVDVTPMNNLSCKFFDALKQR